MAAVFDLSARRALVTGGGGGIGLAIAGALRSAGAAVAVAGRDESRLAEAARGIGGVAVRLDVRDEGDCARGVEEAAAALGGLDILVNNAGVEEVRASHAVDAALWDRIVDTNLRGAFFCAQAAAAQMRRGGGGAILNICSLTSHVGVPTAVAYGASKSGLLGMTRALAAEWALDGVRVNAISPGYFRTAMTEPFYADPGWAEAMQGKIPMRRFGRLDDLAGAAVFFCSDASAYVTGQCLAVDGGFLASI